MSPQDSIDAGTRHVFAEHVWIPADKARLEGWLAYDADGMRCDGVLLLSPHPNFAGTMDNNVIRELAAYLSTAGCAVLRFNYPGIGASTITLPEGVSAIDYWDTVEKDQRFDEAILPATGALNFLLDSLEGYIDRVHVIGYSFGGMIAMMMATTMSSVSSATAISLPWISRYNHDFLQHVTCPKCFISGKRDFTFETHVFQRIWPLVPEPKVFHSVDHDHFFRKGEEELARHILDFLAKQKQRSDLPGK